MALINADRIEKSYLALPVGLRRVIPLGMKTALRNRLLPEWSASRTVPGMRAVRELEVKLWGGFSASALADLRATKLSFAVHPRVAAHAAWILARWHAAQGEFAAALEEIVFVRHADPANIPLKRQFLQEAKFLCLLGRGAETRALLDLRTREAPFDPSVALMYAGSHAAAPPGDPARDEVQVLAHINAVFRAYGFAEAVKRDDALPLSIDNLTARAPSAAAPRRVSVIVPVHNAQDTVTTALRSLAEQAWENLEVLVVDDASTDATAEVVAGFCAQDPRFRLIVQETNGGSYACRNRALPETTGDYVTVHDADDWSHPEKIRLQAESLLRGETPYNFTAWTRTLPGLVFVGTTQATRTLVSLNFSSHMIPRAALIAAGGWDHIRVTGDTELIWRIEALAGRPQDAFRDQVLLPACPLSFGRLSPSSLTGAQATHVLSIHNGLRREYREAAEHWHAELRAAGGHARVEGLGRPRFPAPPVLRPERAYGSPLELLVIGDFNLLGGTMQSAMAMLRAGLASGRECGLMQYRRYDLNVARALNPEVRRFAQAHGVKIVAPGETLRAATVLFTHPPLAAHVLDRFPAISHDHLVVVVNQMAERDLARQDVVYDPARVRANLVQLFGSEGLWAPISERVRALMEADPRYPTPHRDTWTPLIDRAEWRLGEARWRGAERSRPVIGRHGRDHPLKWPRDPEALAAAYCADRACEVHFLGGAQFAASRMGRWPRNWKVEPFGARDVQGFLSALDIFLHYPDPDYIEEFGRAPMEAMALGVPVILPPEFRPTFGEAALYAPPEGVWPLIETLWRDREAWEARGLAGRAFVDAHCGFEALTARLDRLEAARALPVDA